MSEGFRPHASGLIVPAELSREREVWTRAEGKLIDRATKLLESRGLQIFLRCDRPDCQHEPIERRREVDGSVTWRCAHRDRVWTRAF